MIPGPTNIKSCPSCTNLILERTYVSWNTFGSVVWCDGKEEGPMLPEDHWLVKCPHCGDIGWIDGMELIKEIQPHEENTVGNAMSSQEPTFKEYLSFIEHSKPKPEKEHYIRIKAWHKGNNKRRVNNKELSPPSIEAENLRALQKLLDISIPEDRIMMAEICRELSEFSTALKLLSGLRDEDNIPPAKFIKLLSLEKTASIDKFDLNRIKKLKRVTRLMCMK